MGRIGVYIYSRPLEQVAILMCVLLLIWTKAASMVKGTEQNAWKVINGGVCLVVLLAIGLMTLNFRESDVYQVVLRPFAAFAEARIQPEIYRSMLMNIFLFFPLGLTLPYVLPGKWKRNVLITILFACVFSFTVEFLQYYYHLGRAETDDVLCNTFGTFIGTWSYILSRKFNNT